MAIYNRTEYSVDKDGNIVETNKRYDGKSWGPTWRDAKTGITGSGKDPEAFFSAIEKAVEKATNEYQNSVQDMASTNENWGS